MIQDAEKFSDQDKQVKERVEVRNDLESLAYSIKNQVKDKEKMGGKLSDDEIKTIEDAADEAIKWMENNPQAETSDYKKQKANLESVVQPIVSKLYEGAAPPPPTESTPKEEL
ncbi:Heat shock 70 kDa protein C [Echinococcus granulosus]|nr:Heat shock 70 kDa protein C [Echinococcus granulosus]